MSAKQLSVFIENRQGRLVEVLQVLKDGGISILSMSLADTTEYGLLRLIVNDPESCKEKLSAAGFSTLLTRVLVVKAPGYGKADLFAKEKMCPVIAAYAYDTWEEGVAIAHANLEVEGKGHSVCIHSHNSKNVEYAAGILPVSRFLVNQICSTNNGGSFFNSLSATTTLGCGSWGNNSISENLSWKHLFNVSRIAYVRPGATQPTDEEIWG